jgi:hypothetical protein
MTAPQFREMLRIQQPVLVKTTDGDTFRIHHPDYALINLDDTAVTIFDADEHYRVVAMNHIVSLEPVRDAARKQGRR